MIGPSKAGFMGQNLEKSKFACRFEKDIYIYRAVEETKTNKNMTSDNYEIPR
jgi:hypothetical protein